jgi:transposase-like protein
MICPRCGSDDIRKMGHQITLRGKKQRYLCHKGHTFYDKNDYYKKKR